MFLRSRASRGAVAALAACSLAVAIVAGSAADNPNPIFSTSVVIHVAYAPDCTFTMTIDGGITVDNSAAPGVSIPPGPYQVAIRTPLPDAPFDTTVCIGPVFSLTGPGVNDVPNLAAVNYMGTTQNVTLAPSSTYVAVDANHPLLQKFVTTSATGSSSSLLPPIPADTASGTSTQPDVVGSGLAPLRGSLRASVSATGAAALEVGKTPARKLRAGRYSFVVVDSSPRRGFFVEKHGRKAVPLAGVRFTGKKTVTLNLTAGAWTFFSQNGHAVPFVVV
ncbi:MAG TPA: hypothetical protein VH063_03435 [Gaiellaceae bacterium]|jgi:hypothetical protein|nr:hypothetical protein [Gaiellaceae bacterium]